MDIRLISAVFVSFYLIILFIRFFLYKFYNLEILLRLLLAIIVDKTNGWLVLASIVFI